MYLEILESSSSPQSYSTEHNTAFGSVLIHKLISCTVHVHKVEFVSDEIWEEKFPFTIYSPFAENAKTESPKSKCKSLKLIEFTFPNFWLKMMILLRDLDFVIHFNLKINSFSSRYWV
jgi:hypothetical protein